jgi:F1F0 ATPase subunit 2
MTISLAALTLGALAGAALGAVYFALLWLAVRRLPRGRGGARLFVGLALARAALLIGTLAAAAALGVPAEGLLAGVAGFVAIRFAATRRLGGRTPEGPAWR